MRRVLLLVTTLTLFMACEKDAPNPNDLLTTTGLLGQWQIHQQTVNNQPNMDVYCCQFLSLLPDSSLTDLTGSWTYEDDLGSQNAGTFELDTLQSIITFHSANSTFPRTYQLVNANVLYFSYQESSALIEELWERE